MNLEELMAPKMKGLRVVIITTTKKITMASIVSTKMRMITFMRRVKLIRREMRQEVKVMEG